MIKEHLKKELLEDSLIGDMRSLSDKGIERPMMVRSVTHFLKEETVGYGRLQKGNFRRIRTNLQEKAIGEGKAEYEGGVNLYLPVQEDYDIDFAGMKTSRKVTTPYFEIVYSFSNAARGRTGYGSANWTARTLYEFLCKVFNNGAYFIDTYLQGAFKFSPAYTDMVRIVEKLNDNIEAAIELAEEDSYQEESRDLLQSEIALTASDISARLKAFAREIKEDIITRMSTFFPEASWSLAVDTIRKRQSLNLPSNTPGYATGWLIKQCTFSVILSSDMQSNFSYSDTYGGMSAW